jgi:RHS repeat-associated protein
VKKNKALYQNIFKGINAEYVYHSDRLKENIILKPKARRRLPKPGSYGFKAHKTYLMFRSELDYSKELSPYYENEKIAAEAFETTGRLAFNRHQSETAFYLGNDLASFIPKNNDPEFEEEIPVLKRIYRENGRQYVLYGVPYQWIKNLPKGKIIIDPSVILDTPQNCQDAYIYRWDGDLEGTIHNNYGSSYLIYAHAWTKRGIPKYTRTYIQFDFSALPALARISKAELYLTNDGKPHSGGSRPRYSVSSSMLSRVIEPWNEHSITWATKPQVTTEKQHWVKAPTNAYSPLNEDITALVKAVLNSVEGNCGFELKMSPEQRYRSARYASTQHSDPSRWPKLTITYTELSKHFYLKDHLGNIRVTIDQEGEVVGYNDYYPFGLRMPGRSYNGGVDHDPYKYSSKELDEENGLNWYRFDPGRSYDPAIGRWMAVDPLAHKYPSVSPYVYCLNNPIIFIDPNGMEVVGDSASVADAAADVNTALEEKNIENASASANKEEREKSGLSWLWAKLTGGSTTETVWVLTLNGDGWNNISASDPKLLAEGNAGATRGFNMLKDIVNSKDTWTIHYTDTHPSGESLSTWYGGGWNEGDGNVYISPLGNLQESSSGYGERSVGIFFHELVGHSHPNSKNAALMNQYFNYRLPRNHNGQYRSYKPWSF